MRAILRPFPASPGELRQDLRSFSKNRRMSSMPCLSMAMRIDPQAERKPGVALRVVPHLLEDCRVTMPAPPISI